MKKNIAKKGCKFLATMMAVLLIIQPMSVMAEETNMETVVMTATTTSAEFAGGSGTENDPYLIETKVHLNNVRKYLDAHFKMVADIEFTEADFAEDGEFYNEGHGWQPIGDKTIPFKGTFDGNACKISGFYINTGIETDIYIGLFGYSTGIIKNLNIMNSNIIVNGQSQIQSNDKVYAYIGMITGCGSVINCHNSGDIVVTYASTAKGSNLDIGGIVGYGDVIECSNSGNISAQIPSSGNRYVDIYLGGIVGMTKEISQCYNSGNLFASTSRNNSYLSVGGIAGSAMNVNQSYNSGELTTEGGTLADVCTGGICGVAGDSSIVQCCYNTGMINGPSESGGIIGYIGGAGKVYNSFNTGIVNGGYCGGIVGDAFVAVTIENCYNTGVIEKGYFKYGIFSGHCSQIVINNCYCLEGVAQVDSNTISCTIQEMRQKKTYTGFDFDTIWRMGVSSTYLCPELINCPINSKTKDILACDISLDKNQVQYLTLQPTVTVTYNGKQLQLNKDYALQYTVGDKSWMAMPEIGNRIPDIGMAKILVVGIGQFVNNKEIEFEVVKFDLANAELRTPYISNGDGSWSSSNFDMKNFEYDGLEKKQSDFRVCDDNDTIDSAYYDITYKNNINVGTATMIITGKGDYYTGTLEKQFEIYSLATAGWKSNSSGIWYQYSDGSYPYNTRVMIDGYFYAFDSKGYMQRGWVSQSGKWTYHNQNGDAVKGWKQIDGRWYYFDSNYMMLTGWQEIGNAWYFFETSGAMVANKWVGNYYLSSSGAMATNTWIGSYYVDATGKWDPSKEKGSWQKNGSKWWYRHADGSYTRNAWEKIDGYWYHFDYYGWLDTNKWIGNYYVTDSGAMATNTWIGSYYVGADGLWIPGY